MAKKSHYYFEGKVWKYSGPSSWYFVTFPKNISKEIRESHGEDEEGWGRLKAILSIGKSNWNSAIWFDTKHDSYIVPIKAKIRKAEGIADGTSVGLTVELEKDLKF